MPTPPKYKEIFHELRAQLVEGKFSDNNRLPSEAQLVRKYGVSRPTAARALRELQAAGFVERRVGAGTFARQIMDSDVKGDAFVGLIVPGMGITEIFDVICGKLIGLARAHHFSVVWSGAPTDHAATDSPTEQAEAYCRELIDRQVQGAFFAPYGWQNGQAQVNRLIAGRLRVAGIPVVLLDCDVLPFPQRSDFDLVGIDNFDAAYALADHLLGLGCRKLHFIANSYVAPTIAARYAGFREALLRRGIKVDTGGCPPVDPSDTQRITELMRGGPDAFVCGNDYKAGVLMQTLETIGVRVPNEVRIVGFDDVKYASLLRVPLTTMHQPCHDLAAVAWQVMQNRLANPTLPPCAATLAARLVVRQSCGAYMR